MFVKQLSKICKSVIEISWDEVFMVRNTVKNGPSLCLAVICRHRSVFDMQLEEKAPVNDFGRTVPMLRNTAASELGNSVISLL